MSFEKLPFILPIVFIIGPEISNDNKASLLFYTNSPRSSRRTTRNCPMDQIF